MKDRAYSNWFGNGDTNKDVSDAIKIHGKPLKIYYDKQYMAALIYKNKVVVTGYDDSEYQQYYVMDEIDE